MFQRLREARENEGGFTLIELLVVIIIIAILAAIAIPVFLKQREKGWKAQAESAAKNAATAMESYGTENGGSYANANPATLTAQGLKVAPGVTVTVEDATATGYCVKAVHSSLTGTPVFFDSDTGAPGTACV
ncbi:MAG TPA: prepilin-type N-terminal cleavage/methylation domain-containing protein [Rubrobacteraceae bacterium]|nr:prepilin-type N-terminal cleavage/methylation domain-containing protein [Rubrobacteraceae bacterium]